MRHHLTLLLSAIALSALTACNLSVDLGDEDIVGSGQLETRTFDLDEFEEIEIGSAFEASITVDPTAPQSVEVSVDDNIFEGLDIRVERGTLKIRVDDGFDIRTKTGLNAKIFVPRLDALEGSGAAAIGVQANNTRIDTIDASGATSINVGNLKGEDLEIDASGASSVTTSGSITQLTVDSSGASDVTATDLMLDSAVVDASGGSNVRFGEIRSISGSASGASTVSLADADEVRVSTSGLSEVVTR